MMLPPYQWTRRRRVALGIMAMLLLAWGVSAVQVWWTATHDYADHAEAIVVLGAAQYRGRPSPVLRARLERAVELYALGVAPRLVLTGGIGEGDTASEAAVSRAYVLRAGVPDSAILTEHEGRTTSQSLEHVALLLHARHLRRVVLVSDPFHVLRAARLARRHDLEVITSPTRTDDAWSRLARQPGYFFAETVKAPLAMVWQW